MTSFYEQDEDAHRAEIEKLNNFPELRMILNPGGCAFYEFPVADDQFYMFVQPAAKKGQYHQDYCDKVRATPVSGNRFDSVSTFRLRTELSRVPKVHKNFKGIDLQFKF